MSRSPAEPGEISQAQDPRSDYRQQLKRLDSLINRGGSLSGHERNCAFLNLGNKVAGPRRFATVSSVAGVDFPDDARAYALTDWDDDGDVDVWTMNRTGPRVRFLRNDQDSGNHFLALRLVGRTCNRDALGARVEVHLEPASRRRFVKSVRAGDGFLSQSSKRLVFGLGSRHKIAKVTVDWPGGRQETFTKCHVDGHYELHQGDGIARPIEPQRVHVREAADKLSPLPSTDRAAIFLASRLALPPMPFNRTVGGKTSDLSDGDHFPVLVNLWASWCLPCQKELHDIAAHAPNLQQQGLHIVALSVDPITNGNFANAKQDASTTADAARIIDRHGNAIQMGLATRPLVDRFQFFEDLLFAQKRPLVIPTSYLLDHQGRLSAIYRGPIDFATLQQHLDKLQLRGKARYDEALPFAGIWFRPHVQRASLKLSAQMFANGYPRDAAVYTLAHEQQLVTQPGFVTLCGQLASHLASQEERSSAIQLYRAALRRAPRNIPVMNNLAWELATRNRRGGEDAREAVQWARRAAELTNFKSASVLDTFAAALAASGDSSAARRALRQALAAAQETGDRPMIDKLQAALRNTDSN